MKIERVLNPIIRDVAKEHNLHISALRDCTLENTIQSYLTKLITSGFWVQDTQMKLEEAKEFSYKFIDDYLHTLLSKKVIQKGYRKEDIEDCDFGKNLNWFCFRITFWNERLNRVDASYIAQIQCEDGKIMYYTADEG